MFGRNSIHDEHAKAIAEIDAGMRREPQHDVPAEIRGKWESGEVDPVDEYVFEEFLWFGAMLDRFTDDAWAIEETSDTMCRAWYLDAPAYGRRWIVYYNALKLGWIEVSANPKRLFGTLDEFRSDPNAQVDMNLDLVRFIPSEHTYGLLQEISFLMQSVEDGYDAAEERARQAAESAMVHYMWDVMRAGEKYVPTLDFSVEGPYAVYNETVTRWRTAGYNPFTRMAGSL